MKFVKHPPKTNMQLSAFLQKEGWNKIKEPNNITTAMLLAIPFMVCNAFAIGFLFYHLFPQVKAFFHGNSFFFQISLIPIILYLFITFVMLIIHEILHAIWIPNFLTSNKTVWGIRPFGGFVATTEPLTKSRFIIISLFPFAVISIVVPVLFSLLHIYHPLLLFLCVFNAMGSCVDIFNLLLIAFQVPNKATIINNGFETYYK